MTATVPATLRLRVTVTDAWRVCLLEAKASERFATLKQRALAAAQLDAGRALVYVSYPNVKCRQAARQSDRSTQPS